MYVSRIDALPFLKKKKRKIFLDKKENLLGEKKNFCGKGKC